MDTQRRLKEKKLTITPQRKAILDFLLSTKEHLTAEAIYFILKSRFPMLSKATVYNNLKTLAEKGCLQALHLGEGGVLYDWNPNDHPHLLCSKCGRVIDVKLSSPVHILSDECKIEKIELNLYGICKDCLEIIS